MEQNGGERDAIRVAALASLVVLVILTPVLFAYGVLAFQQAIAFEISLLTLVYVYDMVYHPLR